MTLTALAKCRTLSVKSAGKIMALVFWDTQGDNLVDFLPRGETVNSDSYIGTLKSLRARILRLRPVLVAWTLEMSSLCMTMLDPTQASEQGRQLSCLGGLHYHMHRTCLYHLFVSMKQGLRGKHYEKCSQDMAERATNTLL